MIIIKLHQILIENDLQLDIDDQLDLESQIRNQKLVPRLNYVYKSGIIHDFRSSGW